MDYKPLQNAINYFKDLYHGAGNIGSAILTGIDNQIYNHNPFNGSGLELAVAGASYILKANTYRTFVCFS